MDTCNLGVENYLFNVKSFSTQCGHVFSVTVDNIRIPSFNELEMSAQVRGHTVNTNCYVLESNMN